MRQHIRGGALDRTGMKAIYVAPMKALAQEVVTKFSKRLKPLGLVRLFLFLVKRFISVVEYIYIISSFLLLYTFVAIRGGGGVVVDDVAVQFLLFEIVVVLISSSFLFLFFFYSVFSGKAAGGKKMISFSICPL